ncbi:molybdenum transporter, partial [Halorubrum sp. SP3]
MRRRQYLRALGLAGAASLAGCTTRAQTPSGDRGTVTLATATTAYDSGLLPVLNRGYADRFGARVESVVRGTGASLRTARDGDC